MHSIEPITPRRRLTRSNIFQYLYYHKEFCSKQSIASDLGLSLPTVYQNLTELMEAGLVSYSSEHRYTGGRRAIGLQVVPDARLSVGISVSDDRVRFLLADLYLNVLGQRKVTWKFDGNITALSRFLVRELESFLDEHLCDRKKILGVGIALPGIINSSGDHMIMAPTLHLQDTSLTALRENIPYPVYIQNDATCGGHAEWFMENRNRDNPDANLAYLSLENGVGGAILLRGRPYIGNHGRSGEFGHMVIERNGRPCTCGKRGCLEAYCSAHRISQDLGISPDEFFKALDNGNEEYRAVWDDMLHYLAIAVNNIHMAIDCDIVLGGFLSEYLERYIDTLRSYVAENSLFSKDGSYVQLSALKSYSVPLGAALFFIQSFIESV